MAVITCAHVTLLGEFSCRYCTTWIRDGHVEAVRDDSIWTSVGPVSDIDRGRPDGQAWMQDPARPVTSLCIQLR